VYLDNEREFDAFIDRMWTLAGPIAQNMGWSGVAGACAAAALKVGQACRTQGAPLSRLACLPPVQQRHRHRVNPSLPDAHALHPTPTRLLPSPSC
jgi:hypothetical protein